MTISTSESKINHLGDGIEDVFEFNFLTLDEDHIRVFFDGTEEFSDFVVTLNPDQDSNPGGNVQFTIDPPAAGVTVTILRTVPLTQLVDYTSYDAFPAVVHEQALDNLTMQTQQLQEEVDRSYKAPVDTQPGDDFRMPEYEAGKLIGWSDLVENELVNAEYSMQDISDEADRARDEADRSRDEANISQSWQELSRDYANEDEDVPVQGQLYSAKHYAIKALKAAAGLNLIGPFRGDDLCDKPGDGPGECIPPDTRNPGQRYYARVFNSGDSFIVSSPGTMEVNDPDQMDPPVTHVVPVEAGDYVIFLNRIEDGDSNVIIAEGWYHVEGLSGAGAPASSISFDDTQTDIKGTSVQEWNENADDELLRRDGTKEMTGDLLIRHGLAPRMYLQPANAGGQPAYVIRDVNDNDRMIAFLAMDGKFNINLFDDSGTFATQLSMDLDGNVSINGDAPLLDENLTRKDYVDLQDTDNLAEAKDHADNIAPWQNANKFVSLAAPDPADGEDGDIWFQYEN